MVGINPDYDYLYDPQQAPPVGFCERCRREIYRPGQEICDDCLEKMKYGDEE